MVGMETLLSWAGFTTKSRLPFETQEIPLKKSKAVLNFVESGLDNPTASECPSQLNLKKDKTGAKLIEDKLAPILYEAWKSGFSVQSNFFRDNAGLVAMAASMQLITTRITEGVYGSTWQITAKGIRLLNELEYLLED